MITGFWLAVFIYFLPTLVALARENDKVLVVFLINIFGFLGIIWIIALFVAIFGSNRTKKHTLLIVERK